MMEIYLSGNFILLSAFFFKEAHQGLVAEVAVTHSMSSQEVQCISHT